MKKIIFLFLLISFLNLQSAQDLEERKESETTEVKNNDLDELIAIRDKLKTLRDNLKNLKVFKRRKGKLSSQGIDLFGTIIIAFEKFEKHNNDLKSDIIYTIGQDEFWQLPVIPEIDLIVKSREAQKDFIQMSIEKISDTKLINTLTGNFSLAGCYLFLHIYQNTLRIMYYLLKESMRFYGLKSKKIQGLFIFYPLYEEVRSFDYISKVLSGKLDFSSEHFIDQTLEILIASYNSYFFFVDKILMRRKNA